ncbi:hypothetical protein [Streptomyces sp. NPDC058874]|uniref:hypothetical protein n=1 Tax=unclassified Streptomyces TaxID=2593676 RepID=UPI00368CD26B
MTPDPDPGATAPPTAPPTRGRRDARPSGTCGLGARQAVPGVLGVATGTPGPLVHLGPSAAVLPAPAEVTAGVRASVDPGRQERRPLPDDLPHPHPHPHHEVVEMLPDEYAAPEAAA